MGTITNFPQPKVPEIKMVTNRPNVDLLITPYFIYETIEKYIIDNKNFITKFQETIKQFNSLPESIKTANCKSCEVNRLCSPLLKEFVKELKTLNNDEDKTFIINLLGEKRIISIEEKWVNVVTNEIIPFEYRVVSVNPGQRVNQNIDKLDYKKFIFYNKQGPGDIVMLTAAIRDLHRNFPNTFITDVQTSSMSIWESNPYVEVAKGTPLNEKDQDVKLIRLEYPLIHKSNEGPYHFSEAFTEEIEEKLGIRIKDRIGKGDIHIGPNEQIWGWTERSTWFKEYGVDPETPYWVIDAGHKLDFTAKFWGHKKFQELVYALKNKITFVQIGHASHIHPKLDGVINLIGKTDDRQLIRLIWASSGVITPVSFPMVLSAAIPVKAGTCNGRRERPCVVIAGGREPSRWQAHTTHQFIHTCGCLPCCDVGGCWASRIKPIGDNDEKDFKNLCKNVVLDEYGEETPYCMDMISVEDVIKRIEMYFSFYAPNNKNVYTYNGDKQ